MTWVVGFPTPFGAAVAVSDVRVSFPDGSTDDCLRKVYPVHRNMACGFSGSVKLGFEMLTDLARGLSAIPPDSLPLPAVMTWRWWRRARRLFAAAPAELQRAGSSLMILGVSPLLKPGIPWPRSYVATLRAPDFRPSFVAGFDRCGSIGSGDDVEEYRRVIEGDNRFLLQAAVGQDRPGPAIAQFLASRLNFTVRARRVAGVSEHLQVTGVDLGGVWLPTCGSASFARKGWSTRTCPR